MSDNTFVSGLLQYDILDTEPEPRFDRIVQMTARLFDAPISAISFLDIDRQWFKARYGFAFNDVPCAGALCRQTIRADGGTVVLDAAADERFRGDPLVAGAPGIRFYAGAGIDAGDGQIIGALFVADDRPRAELQAHALEELQMLARLVEAEIECRDMRRTLTDAMDRFRELADVSSDWVWETDSEHRLVGLFSGPPLHERHRLGRHGQAALGVPGLAAAAGHLGRPHRRRGSAPGLPRHEVRGHDRRRRAADVPDQRPAHP